MRVLNNASYLFFNRGYSLSDVTVFNGVDAATGAPSMPATGAPGTETPSESPSSLDSLKSPVEDIQGHISTLQQMGASSDADQQQSALEAKIQEFKKSLDAMNDSCQSMILKYRQEGVPNLDASAQAGNAAAGQGVPAGGMDMGLGGMPGGGDPLAAESMAPAPGAPAAPQAPPMPTGDMGELPASGASAPGMTTYDDLMQQNQQGVTGQGGSTMPPIQ